MEKISDSMKKILLAGIGAQLRLQKNPKKFWMIWLKKEN